MSPPDPYDLRMRDVLFATDTYRLCQLVTLPAAGPESAVYIAVGEDGTTWVVSRTLNVQLWTLMMSKLQDQRGERGSAGSASTGPDPQRAALDEIHASTNEHRAELDRATVDVVARACEAVLRRVHYQTRSDRVDGVTYHAGHWIPGQPLSGRTQSPEAGTMASDYLELGETLKAYARGDRRERRALTEELLAKAERIVGRARPGD